MNLLKSDLLIWQNLTELYGGLDTKQGSVGRVSWCGQCPCLHWTEQEHTQTQMCSTGGVSGKHGTLQSTVGYWHVLKLSYDLGTY